MMRGFALSSLIVAFGVVGCGGGGDGGGGTPPITGPPGSIAEVEPNDPTPQTIGALDATDKVIFGVANGRNDVDLYSVTLTSPGNIYMSLSWTGAQDLEVGVTDPNGIVIHNQDTPTANPEECIVTGRAVGTYIVRVGAHGTGGVYYLLTVGIR
jgi:hypothetical protein